MSLAPAPPEPPPPREPATSPHTGRLVGGVLLVVLGVGWLLEILDVEFPWEVLVPAGLIAVGLALLLVAQRGGSHGGLVTVGIVLTVVLLLGSIVDISFEGGVGERSIRPTTVTALEDTYQLFVGQMTIDLRELDVADSPEVDAIEANVGIGQLIVIAPSGLGVRVTGTAGVGNVTLFGDEGAGFDVERSTAPSGDVQLELALGVGIGQVELRRG